MANLTPWARWCADAHQKMADAIGHGLDTATAKQCLALAETALSSAERAATPGNKDQLDHIARLWNLLGQYKLGSIKDGVR